MGNAEMEWLSNVSSVKSIAIVTRSRGKPKTWMEEILRVWLVRRACLVMIVLVTLQDRMQHAYERSGHEYDLMQVLCLI